MNRSSLRIVLMLFCLPGMQGLQGCTQDEPRYGQEARLALPARRPQVWAVAPAINLSGQDEVDPILQADLLFAQLQQVRNITAVPVNRTAEVYASLGITQVQSEEQAALVCELLGCDALLVPTVTAYDPYSPPTFGGSLQLFEANGPAGRSATARVDPRALARSAAPPDEQQALPGARATRFRQSVGLFDAANGSVRDAVSAYAAGRNDPLGPLGEKEYLVSMDRFVGFAYHELLARLFDGARLAGR